MSRNYHQGKHYEWERRGDLIICSDAGDRLFTLFDEGGENNMINVYMKGRSDGERRGRLKLQAELRGLLGEDKQRDNK